MILKATAIPLTCHPYSSTSRIVHWLTRHHGKISTLLKGALRPKSPFLGEYELFGTSELLYIPKRIGTLHTAKECALLHPRPTFRTNWRAMQAASYLTTLFNRTTPDESPHPELFEFFEELLDFAEEQGHEPLFIPWAELQFCTHHGHAPNLKNCTLCASEKELRFCVPQGGLICEKCSKIRKLPTLESPPDLLDTLRAWLQSDRPPAQTTLSLSQKNHLHTLLDAFMRHHFNIPSGLRNAALFEL